MAVVYVFGRGAHFHADSDCEALSSERAAVQKRGGVMTPVITARPGTTATEGRTPCTVCS
jgi:hypothetical protein